MSLQYIDIHSHQNDPVFDTDKEAVFARMFDASVGAIMVGTDKDMSQRAISDAEKFPNTWATIGQHPTDKHDEVFDEKWYDEKAKHAKVVGIGECGLDYFRMKVDTPDERKRQRELFLMQLHLATRHDLPLMIHCRDAHNEMLDILTTHKKEYGDKLRGNIHFYSADWETAKRYFDLDFTVSFTGVLTFTHDYDEVIKNAPLERMMTETDCPYVSPVPHRGKRNESSFVPLVAEQIALVRGEDRDSVAQILLQTAMHRWKLTV